MEPWRKPAVTFYDSDLWPLGTTVCFLSLKKRGKRSKTLPEMPFCDNVKRKFLYQTLSKTSEMFKKMLQTPNPLSNEL